MLRARVEAVLAGRTPLPEDWVQADEENAIKIIAGVYQPNGGAIRFAGRPVQILNPRHAQEMGIAAIYQESSLYNDLSVAENVFMGRHPGTGPFRAVDWDAMARELIAATGDTTGAGPANFLARGIQTNGPGQDTLDNLAASTGRIFLAENAIFCTSCHNGAGHLDSINLWGSTVRRQDFWGISAFYSRVSIARQPTAKACRSIA